MDRLIKKNHIWSSLLLIVLLTATAHGTVYIPADTSIGTWDDVSRIFTLTTDLSETIEITEDNLTVDGAGYTATGAGSGFGAYLSSRTAVTIRNLNVEGFSTGICLESSSGSTVEGNTVWDNTRGITLSWSGGNTVTNNLARDNGLYGILLSNSNDNTLGGNTADGNGRGIFLSASSDNSIAGNTISGNTQGIYFTVSHRNEIYNNNFIGNTTQALVYYSDENVFNLDEPTGGNFWSDWTGPDGNGDGFADSPYVFTGGQDDFPWVVQDGWASGGPPTWPAASTMTASGVGLTSLILTWTPAVHDVGVAQYSIFQDGVQIASIAGTVTTFNVTMLEPDTEYGFEAEARDAAGGCSTDGPSVIVRTLTSQEGVRELGNQVAVADVDDRIEGGLTAKLNSAERALGRANKNSRTTAVNLLGAFINAVEAQSGKKIPQADADALVAAAQEIITVLSAQ